MFGLETCGLIDINNDGAIPVVGQIATANSSGVASFTIALPNTPAAGSYLVAAISSSGGALIATITDTGGGGGTWVNKSPGSTNKSCYVKLCNGTEPASYTVTYNGTLAGDNCTCALMEILNANATNPDDSQGASNTGTAPSATSSSDGDLAVVVATDSETGGSGNFNAAPTGYTLQANISDSGGSVTIPCVSSIATLNNCGSGTISPGVWGSPGSVNSRLFTILFKP